MTERHEVTYECDLCHTVVPPKPGSHHPASAKANPLAPIVVNSVETSRAVFPSKVPEVSPGDAIRLAVCERCAAAILALFGVRTVTPAERLREIEAQNTKVERDSLRAAAEASAKEIERLNKMLRILRGRGRR